MISNPEEKRNINLDSIIVGIWGIIFPHISAYLRTKSSKFSEAVLPEKARDIIASLVGFGAQIFEKKFKGVYFEIISDILEQISTGIKAPDEEKAKAKPEERKSRYEWPSLEELIAMNNAQTIGVKRELLLDFSSRNLHEKINKLSDEEINDLINVLIILEQSKRELMKLDINLDLKSIWQMISEIFRQVSQLTGRSLTEAARFIKNNLAKINTYLTNKINQLSSNIEGINQKSNKWRLF